MTKTIEITVRVLLPNGNISTTVYSYDEVHVSESREVKKIQDTDGKVVILEPGPKSLNIEAWDNR